MGSWHRTAWWRCMLRSQDDAVHSAALWLRINKAEGERSATTILAIKMKGIVLWLFCLVVPSVSAYKKRILNQIFDLSNTCERVYVNVHDYDEIDVRSMERRAAPHSASAGSSCMAYFKTINPGQGLCIRMQGVLISEYVTLAVRTGVYSPERIFQANSPWRGNWCFPDSVLTLNVSTTAPLDNVDRAIMFNFVITNVSLDTIQRNYYMDSFVECGLSHKLTAGKKVTLEGERNPRVTSDLPDTCQLSFESTSQEEHEQLCLELRVTSDDDVINLGQDNGDGVGSLRMVPEQALKIEGLNPRFYSTAMALSGQTSCSQHKRLNLTLTRNDTHFFNFRATISSQWHPNWEVEESEASELLGLRIVKGITYFIATIDSLVAVLGAGLAFILKRPAGPWRRWAEEFNAQTVAHAPQPYPATQDPGSYGSMHACKDGNYPEMPLEGATPTNEVLVETHTY